MTAETKTMLTNMGPQHCSTHGVLQLVLELDEEVGFYEVNDGINTPCGVKLRPPSFLNIQALPKLIEGDMIADVVAIVGSFNFVLGEAD